MERPAALVPAVNDDDRTLLAAIAAALPRRFRRAPWSVELVAV